MKTNLTLIGMPGAGKSTIGIILAKVLSFGFVDTDILIQIHQQKSLQQLLDDNGHLHLREVEEEEILRFSGHQQVIATGGSAVYSEKAMAHLGRISTIVFIEVAYEEIERRIKNFDTRGIAKAKDQSFRELFDERQTLYRHYAEIQIDANHRSQDALAEEIAARFREFN